VPIAGNDLRGDRLMLQAELRDDTRLVVRAERRVGADRARDRRRDLVEGTLEPIGVAVRLDRVAGELQTERRRLGMDAVGAADAQRVRVLAGLLGELSGQGPGRGNQDPSRALELERETGVDDVGGRQAVVDPAAGLAR